MLTYLWLEGVNIVRGPRNTTVCAHQNATMFCGFTGADPDYLVLNWSIIFRNEFDNVLYVKNYSVCEINRDQNNDLDWIPDHKNPYNSKLIINTTNDMFNRSSFQCIIIFGLGDIIASNTGSLLVAGKIEKL